MDFHQTEQSGHGPVSETDSFHLPSRECLLQKETAPQKETDFETRDRAEQMARFLQEKKGRTIWILAPGEACAYADFLIMADVEHERHRDAVLEMLDRQFSKRGEPFRAEKGHFWTLVDFGSVVIHLFLNSGRSLYRLEDLFPTAPLLVLDETGRLETLAPEHRPIPEFTENISRRLPPPLRHPSV
ncbi:hypothetical protein LptCag_2327 [Leptospirillum ferriphilum]|jgi:ribosome-associated protein|uniref:Ribosomal silencing factor RsfS n=3 Tax=Leptospirillum TaxID=179 RepID=A0A094WBG4_9BACT|nr:MAG: Conserved protein of unknown function [Leptospirillum sp. Group II '5-way CG']KGA94893.1 hypothetical protein LptCag_2327 [Leptospirillum ferriphilum]